MYFNYHAQAKMLIKQNHLVKYQIVEKWNNISPALVLFFDNHKPMPIRQKDGENIYLCSIILIKSTINTKITKNLTKQSNKLINFPL